MSISNQKGFTLIEMIAAMVILSVMTSVSVQKFEFLSVTATDRAINEGIRELNIRESLTWTKIKLSTIGYTNDDELFSALASDLGGDLRWTSGPNPTGGTLSFRTTSVVLHRTPSTPASVGSWK